MSAINTLKQYLVIANVQMMGRRPLTEEELLEMTMTDDIKKLAEFCRGVWNDPKITVEMLEEHLANIEKQQ